VQLILRDQFTQGLPHSSSTWIHRPGIGWKQLNQYHLAAGLLLLQKVKLDQNSAARGAQSCAGRALQPTAVAGRTINRQRCKRSFEYGERFQIEEELLDPEIRRHQLERSEVHRNVALSRLCLSLAVATLMLTVQGQQVVSAANADGLIVVAARQQLFVGWNWLKGMLHRAGTSRCSRVSFQSDPAFALEATGSRPVTARKFTVRPPVLRLEFVSQQGLTFNYVLVLTATFSTTTRSS